MKRGVELEGRLRRLERWNAALVLAVLAMGGALGWRSAPPFGPGADASRADVLRAERIEVMDAQGRARIVLQAGPGGPTLEVLDDVGMARATLGDDADGTALYLKDGEGTTRVGVAQFAHGGGGFALHGPRAEGAAVLYLKGDGSLTFYGAEGEVRARFPGG